MLQIFEISTLKDMLLTSIFWPGESHGLHSPWDCKESDTTDGLTKAKVIQGRIVKDSESVCKSESVCIYLFFFTQRYKTFYLLPWHHLHFQSIQRQILLNVQIAGHIQQIHQQLGHIQKTLLLDLFLQCTSSIQILQDNSWDQDLPRNRKTDFKKTFKKHHISTPPPNCH